jgi:two-component system, response regulator YesN
MRTITSEIFDRISRNGRTDGWRLLRRFLISYLIVFIIPIGVSTRVYYAWIQSAKREVIKESIDDLHQIASVFGGRLSEVWSLNQVISVSPDVTALFDLRESLQGSPNVYKVYAANEYLNSPFLYNTFIQEYFVFFVDSDIVISRKGTSVNARFYYGDSFQFEEYTLSEWNRFLFQEYHNRMILPERDLRIDDTWRRVVTCVQSIPIAYPHRPRGVILTLLEPRFLEVLLHRAYAGDASYVYITDENGEVMYTYPDEIPTSLESVPFDGNPDGYTQVSTDRGKLTLTWAVSAENGWHFVAALPERHMITATARARNDIIIVLSLSFGLAALVAYLFSYRNVGPLRHMFAMVQEMFTDSGRDRGGDDLVFIERSIERLLREHQSLNSKNMDLREQVRKQYGFLHEAFMDRLLSEGFPTLADAEEFSRQLNLTIAAFRFVAGILVVEGFSDNLDVQQVVEMDLVRDLAVGTLRRIFRNNVLIRPDERGFSFVVLIDSDHINEYRTWIDLCVHRAAAELMDKYQVRIFCTTGSLRSDVLTVNRSWIEAARIMEYRHALRDKTHVSVDTFRPAPADTCVCLPLKEEERIINLVRGGKWSDVKAHIHEIIYPRIHDPTISPDVKRFLLRELFGTAIRLCDMSGDCDRAATLLHGYERVPENQERISLIEEELERLCMVFQKSLSDRHRSMCREILSFIEENFSDQNIQISDLQGLTNYSVSYLYRFFKDEFGSTFAEYLEDTRIAYAADLLKRNGLLIKEVAVRCGYNSTHAFRRAFKRVKGVSPTEYRGEDDD